MSNSTTEPAEKATHAVSIHTNVVGPAQREKVWERFGKVLEELRDFSLPYISLYSVEIGDDIELIEEEELFHDENTLVKVRMALKEIGILTEDEIISAISSMQNHGILFRERRK